MNLERMIEEVRRKSRSHVAEYDDTAIIRYINDSLAIFSVDTEGVADTFTVAQDTELQQHDLPEFFIASIGAYWNDLPLRRQRFENLHESLSGTPYFFAVRGDQIRLDVVPSKPGTLKLTYYRAFQPFIVGADQTPPESNDLTQETDLLAPYHDAITSYSAAVILDNRFEPDQANRHYGLYERSVRRYVADIKNEDSQIGFRRNHNTMGIFND